MTRYEHDNELEENENGNQPSPHTFCRAHPLQTFKLNLVLAVLMLNLFAMWGVFYKEIKPVLLEVTKLSTEIVEMKKDITTLEQTVAAMRK